MTAVDLFLEQSAPADADVERDRYGRYLINGPDGKSAPYTRATTIAQTLSDKFGLNAWEKRMVAHGLAIRHDLYARVASIPITEKQALDRLCDEAKEAAAASRGANLGTALHRFTERVDAGEDVVIPPPWNADIDVYRRTLFDAGIAIVSGMLEQTVVLHEPRVAGTFDRLVHVPGEAFPLVADLKTGTFLDWTEIAVQLAIYAHADAIYDHATKTTRPMPKVDLTTGLVIHLPAGRAECYLYDVDLAAGWEAFERCLWAREWRKRKDIVSVRAARQSEGSVARATADGPAGVGDGNGVVAPPSSPAGDPRRRAWLIDRIEVMRADYPDALADLARFWPEGIPTFKQSDAHTTVELDAIEVDAIDRAERLHDVPFPPTCPGRERVVPLAEAVVGDTGSGSNVVDLFADPPSAGPAPAAGNGEAAAGASPIPSGDAPAVATRDDLLARLDGDEETTDALLAAAERSTDTLQRLLVCFDAGWVGLDFEPDKAYAHAMSHAEVELVRRYGSKAGILTAARPIIDRLGRPKLRGTAAVLDDVVLVAHLLTDTPNQ